MAETPSGPFIMHGARDAMEGGLAHIREHVNGIEEAVVQNPGLAFDLAKTLVESACRTVLSERSVTYAETDDLPKLFRTVTQQLPFLPSTASHASEVRDSLKRTLSGLSAAIQGICELRNQCGFASHGSDSPRPAMERVQALLAAEAADAIVGFLHRVHRADRNPPRRPAGEAFDDNSAFNDSLDESFGPFRVFEIEFRPSEVLYALEPETYRIYLADYGDTADPETQTSVDERGQS